MSVRIRVALQRPVPALGAFDGLLKDQQRIILKPAFLAGLSHIAVDLRERRARGQLRPAFGIDRIAQAVDILQVIKVNGI